MRSTSLLLGVALACGLAMPAGADPAVAPPPAQAPAAAPPLTVTPPNPDMVARRLARRAARVDQGIQTLRSGLQLTPAQDALWPAVADAIRGVDKARGFRYRQTLAAAPSPVDALKIKGDHMAAMGAAISKLADATKPLVATLTPDQKSRLPGLLQGVRLPRVMGRALDLPQDTGEAAEGGRQGRGPLGGQPSQAGADRAWGIGPQGSGDTKATREDATPGGKGAAGAAPSGPAATPHAGTEDDDDDE